MLHVVYFCGEYLTLNLKTNSIFFVRSIRFNISIDNDIISSTGYKYKK